MQDTARKGPVISAILALVPDLRKSAGGNWTGCCPIHGEVAGRSKPSFSFNELTGQWNCFSQCGGGGLPQLLRKLGRSAQFVDHTMERLRPFLQDASKTRRKAQLNSGGVFLTDYPLPEKLLGLFEYVPEELVAVGFDERILQDNDVGVDTTLGRTTYAIRDLHGTLAGIVGKPHQQDGRGGKYVVYEREIVRLGFKDYTFSNRRFCWRWEKVYASLYHGEKTGPVLVTEGYKACLWLVQHGYYNTVALMGASLSDTQKMFLERLGTEIVLCLDNNPAGRIGTSKLGYSLKGQDVSVMRYPYPEVNLQPDDLTAEELASAIEAPFNMRAWRRFYEHYPQSDRSPAQRARRQVSPQ